MVYQVSFAFPLKVIKRVTETIVLLVRVYIFKWKVLKNQSDKGIMNISSSSNYKTVNDEMWNAGWSPNGVSLECYGKKKKFKNALKKHA
jgi:hypothetical protein